MATATTSGAREHARSQAVSVREAGLAVPAIDWPTPPEGVAPEQLTWAETVPGGRYSTKVLARGTRLRLRDLDGTACAHLLLWRADAPWERLNVADTVKVPWQAYLGTGHPLLSDQGRVLATIVADSSGCHDALCGTSTLAGNTTKYGAGSPESASPAGRELLILAALKNGLSRRDVPPSISLFHGIRVEPDGTLKSIGSGGAGTEVELIVHLPAIVAIANTAHPLDPAARFSTGPLEILAWSAPEDLAAIGNALTERDPEYQRAYHNTEDLWSAR